MTATPIADQVGSTIHDPRRWVALVIIGVAQLMLVVDASIVNIALPSAQRALHISNANRQWVVTAYTLTFGGLLLLGGRIADYVGRKRIFIIGLIGFASSSAIGGLAVDSAVLFSARALQGAFAAIMAPAALSLLTVIFTDREERARAFGVYGAIAGGGLAIGLVAGGVLTDFASWRWCLLVNVPIGLITAIAASRVIHESTAEGAHHYDLPGAVTITAGLVLLVYGLTEAVTDGWASRRTIGFLVAAAILLVAFVVIEHSSSHPLLPLRVLSERNRGGTFLASLLVGAALYGLFLFLTYYLQGTLHYSPLRSGFAFLPLSIGIISSAAGVSTLLTRFAPRLIMVTGLILTAGGLLWFTQLGVRSAYLSHILPAETVMSVGLGLVFVPVASVALLQVGGSIGIAVLNTIAASAFSAYLATRLPAAHGSRAALARLTATATVHSYARAFAISAALALAALVAVAFLVDAKSEKRPSSDVEGM
jgi:EmrB/QacA subfamily drug resistance transporter